MVTTDLVSLPVLPSPSLPLCHALQSALLGNGLSVFAKAKWGLCWDGFLPLIAGPVPNLEDCHSHWCRSSESLSEALNLLLPLLDRLPQALSPESGFTKVPHSLPSHEF